MPVPLRDRLVMLFVLEGSWLLCVLQLADTPLFAGLSANTMALILTVGAACLAIALLATSRVAHRAVRTCRVAGIAIFGCGLLVCATSGHPAAGGVVLIGLGLVLAVTGMARARQPAGPET